jgi:hypothetical protein
VSEARKQIDEFQPPKIYRAEIDNGLEIFSKELASARAEQPGDASRQPI